VEYGNRIIMMDNGNIVFEKAGAEKEALCVEDVLKIFTDISIECGN